MAALRDAELRAAEARTEAILAESAGELDRAAEVRAEAEHLAAIARGTSSVGDARAAWAAALVQTAREAEERIADRESQEAAHDAADAASDLAAEDVSARDDAFEASAPASAVARASRWPDDV